MVITRFCLQHSYLKTGAYTVYFSGAKIWGKGKKRKREKEKKGKREKGKRRKRDKKGKRENLFLSDSFGSNRKGKGKKRFICTF